MEKTVDFHLKDEINKLKLEIHGINEDLSGKLVEWSKQKTGVRDAKVKLEIEALKVKAEAVKTKLKKRQKLTTQDILIMQKEMSKK